MDIKNIYMVFNATLTHSPRLFTMAAVMSSAIVSHDPGASSSIMADVTRNPHANHIAWEFINSNWGPTM